MEGEKGLNPWSQVPVAGIAEEGAPSFKLCPANVLSPVWLTGRADPESVEQSPLFPADQAAVVGNQACPMQALLGPLSVSTKGTQLPFLSCTPLSGVGALQEAQDGLDVGSLGEVVELGAATRLKLP